MDSSSPIFCRKCGIELTPGHGDFIVVNVEAYAEAGRVEITAADLAKDHRQEIQEILAQLQGLSGQEAMDSVYRRMSFYLCRECYLPWIEEPTGQP